MSLAVNDLVYWIQNTESRREGEWKSAGNFLCVFPLQCVLKAILSVVV